MSKYMSDPYQSLANFISRHAIPPVEENRLREIIKAIVGLKIKAEDKKEPSCYDPRVDNRQSQTNKSKPK